jgi:hypothetical protein
MGHHPEIMILLGQKINEIGHNSFQKIAGRVVCGNGINSGQDFFHAAEKGFHEKGLLIRKIPVDGGMGNAGFGGNVADVDFMKRLDPKDPFCRINNDVPFGILFLLL